MEIKTVFLAFGIGLACFAVIVSFIGLRAKNFPGKGAFLGLLALGAILVIGTAYYAVELSIEEAEHREHHEAAPGEETKEALGVRLIDTKTA